MFTFQYSPRSYVIKIAADQEGRGAGKAGDDGLSRLDNWDRGVESSFNHGR